MNNKNSWVFLIIGLLLGVLAMHFCHSLPQQKTGSAMRGNGANPSINPGLTKRTDCWNCGNSQTQKAGTQDIAKLTDAAAVANYIRQNHQLPDFYITKSEAKKLGWQPGQSLCEALPGRAIGGDHFSNREKSLPEGNQYFEADVNYDCGHRNADRLIFTINGDVWLTKDHYKTFQKQ